MNRQLTPSLASILRMRVPKVVRRIILENTTEHGLWVLDLEILLKTRCFLSFRFSFLRSLSLSLFLSQPLSLSLLYFSCKKQIACPFPSLNITPATISMLLQRVTITAKVEYLRFKGKRYISIANLWKCKMYNLVLTRFASLPKPTLQSWHVRNSPLHCGISL